MTNRSWTTATLSGVAFIVCLNLLFAWHMDIFGVLRDTRGRALVTGRHEHQAKYLLNFKYVPENFDALVIGSSASVNWNLDQLTGYRFYNESIFAANATEERMLVDKALEHGTFKVALISLGQVATDSHTLEDGLDQASPSEALGSMYFYFLLLDHFLSRLHPNALKFHPNGSHDLAFLSPDPPDPDRPRVAMTQDPKALNDLITMIEELQARGTRIIYFVPPHYEMDRDGSRVILLNIVRTFQTELPPAPMIDFTADRYAALRNDPRNFVDEQHLSPAGAALVPAIINQRLHEILGDK